MSRKTLTRWLAPLVFALILLASFIGLYGRSFGSAAEPTPTPATLPDFTSHTADVNGISIHYVIGGHGPALVLLHGWPQTWWEWHRIMPALAKQYTVIAPDTRGLGDSSKPSTGYDENQLADDIYQLVQSLGYHHIRLVGHDLGGWIAVAYAAAHPTDVVKLGILEITQPGFGFEKELDDSTGHGFFWPPFHMVADLPEALTAGRERTYLSWFYTHAAYKQGAITSEDIDEYVRCYSEPGEMSAGFNYYRAFFTDVDQTRADAAQMLQMPVLALGGEYSFGSAVAESMSHLASNVQGVIVPNAGHWLNEEQPDFVTDQLLTFLH